MSSETGDVREERCVAAAEVCAALAARPGNCADCAAPMVIETLVVCGREFFANRLCAACSETRAQARRQAELQEMRARQTGVWERICPPTYRLTDSNHPAINPALLAQMLRWRPGGKGIGLCGDPRLGKTRMMFLLLRELHFAGIGVAYVRATALAGLGSLLFDDAEKYETRNQIKRLHQVPVLFIDDLSKERCTDRSAEQFYDLIEDRGTERATLWTSIYDGEKLEKMMGERGPAILGRLREFSDIQRLRPALRSTKPTAATCRKAA